RSADSRPAPGPFTWTSSTFTPCSDAFLAAESAATCAAYGVDLREPLKPLLPDEAQATALPWSSVMVIIVLLKLAFTCATPEVMVLRSRRLTRPPPGAPPAATGLGVSSVRSLCAGLQGPRVPRITS